MKKNLLIPLIAVGLSQFASAVTILFEENFNVGSTANISTGVITGDNSGKAWTASQHGASVRTVSVGDEDGNGYALVSTTFPTSDTAGFAGAQFQVNTGLTGQTLNNYPQQDIFLSVRIQVEAQYTVTNPNIGFQIRQNGHFQPDGVTVLPQNRTHTLGSPIPNYAGDWYEITFNLSQYKQAGFTTFNNNPVTVLFEIAQNWRTGTGDNIVDFYVDSVRVYVIPEPSTTLLGVAALPLLLRRRRA